MVKRKKRILIIDDDRESLISLKDYLESEQGYDVELTAEKNILDRLGNEHFDLLIVDLLIHRKSIDDHGNEVDNIHYDEVSWQDTGFEFLRRFRRGDYEKEEECTRRDVKILVLSAVGSSAIANLHNTENLQIDHCIDKPFILEELAGWISRLLH